MPLTISLTKKPKENVPFVFFLWAKDDIAKKPLFRFLGEGERDYLEKIKASLQPKEKEVKFVIAPGSGRKIIVIGAGTPVMSGKQIGLLHRIAVQAARKEKIEEFAFWAAPQKTNAATIAAYEVAASNAVMANFEFVKYKTSPPEGFFFMKAIEAVSDKVNPGIKEGLKRGMVIGEETNRCRELANTPGADMTPAALAEHAQKASAGLGITATILDKKKMKSLGMGGVLGVGQGSDSPPRFIVLEYLKGPKSKKPTVLVGKGVTFDSGGLNLKSSDGIYDMHLDMSGGAAVIHTLIAAARLKLKKNIVVLVPAVENMPSGRSYRPADVLRTMNGKTIEVLNTDAEGRVILADALEYAKQYEPSLVVDVATLTGAAIVALGLFYTGLFTPNKPLEEKFRKLGDETWDPVWPLPLGPEYEDGIRGTFGDWANSGKKGQGGGATNGAMFLWQFTKDAKGVQEYPWVHLDTAPRMTANEGEYLAKGAIGAPVRLLVRMLEE